MARAASVTARTRSPRAGGISNRSTAPTTPIAAPIFGRDGVVAGAIGVVGAVERLLVPPARGDLVRAVTEAARAISRDLGAARGGTALTALS